MQHLDTNLSTRVDDHDSACGAGFGRLSDGELAAHVAAGDASHAAAELRARFERRAALFGRYHLKCPELAEEVGRKVLALVTRRLTRGAIRDPERIAQHVRCIAHSLVRDLQLAQGSRHPTRDPEPVARASSRATALAARLVRCLETLDDPERDVLIATGSGEQRPDRLARALALSVEEVRHTRTRAILRVQRALQPELEGVTACAEPSATDLIDYSVADLSVVRERAVEAHFFECASCAGQLDEIDRLLSALRESVRRGGLRASAASDVLDLAPR